METVKNIIKKCESFNKGKTTEEDFSKYLSELTVYKRLSMYKKGMYVSMAMLDLDDLQTKVGFEADVAIEIERLYVIRFILSYIETSDTYHMINSDDIETMYASGLIDYVLDICERDYSVMKSMFDNAMKLKYIAVINELLGSVTSEQNAENIDKVAKIFEDKKTVSNVVEIMQYNDPALKSLKDEVFAPLEKEIRK